MCIKSGNVGVFVGYRFIELINMIFFFLYGICIYMVIIIGKK